MELTEGQIRISKWQKVKGLAAQIDVLFRDLEKNPGCRKVLAIQKLQYQRDELAKTMKPRLVVNNT